MPIEQEYILKKIDQIETKLEGHVGKIENRLDQIVHLMQQVATLQEKESRNSDDIRGLRLTLKESVDAFNSTIKRVHDRLDDKEKSCESTEKMFDEKIEKVEIQVNEIDKRVSSWMNRGIGIWTAASVFVVVIQIIAGLYIKSIQEDYQTVKVRVEEMAKKQNDLEHTISVLANDLKRVLPQK